MIDNEIMNVPLPYGTGRNPVDIGNMLGKKNFEIQMSISSQGNPPDKIFS